MAGYMDSFRKTRTQHLGSGATTLAWSGYQSRFCLFRNSRFLFALLSAAMVLAPSVTQATTRIVTSLADSGTGTLREAIDASDNGDVITFSVTGVVGLTSGALDIMKNITITGPGSSQLEITRAGGNQRIFAIFFSGGAGGPTVTITGLAITNGHNTQGAGVYAVGNVTIRNCLFRGNNADFGFDGEGGAIFSDLSLVVSDCTFDSNVATDDGGALTLYGGNADISRCTFTNNSVTYNSLTSTSGVGGAIFQNGSLSMSNCTFSGNNGTSGGAIYSISQSNNAVVTTNLTGCTFSQNTATNGGAVYNTASNGGNSFVTLANTILQKGATGANLVNTGLGTSISSQGYNLSDDNGGGFLIAAGDQINTNPQLGPLQDNGGSTATMALLPGSPAQDKGKSFGLTTDQRGIPRPIDIAAIGNANGGDGADIGAVELDTSQTGPTFVVTTIADHNDGTCSVGDCTLREAINVSNSANGANTITFASGLTGVITLQSALGTLTVNDSVSITGPGARVLAVSGNNTIPVLIFNNGTSTLSGLTIRDGKATAATGSGASAMGGGLFNAQGATLTINNCAFTGNSAHGADNATAASAGGNGNGGAIFNGGVLTLNGCTVSGNSALGGRGGDGSSAGGSVRGGNGGAAQGAIFNDTNAILTMTNCTVVNNTANGGTGGSSPASGGGFAGNGGEATGGLVNAGTVTVTATTFVSNFGTGGNGGTGTTKFNGGSAGKGVGGIASKSNATTVRDTITADNGGNGTHVDVDGSFTSSGYNLIGAGDSSTGFTATGDQVGTATAPLPAGYISFGNNGGGTDTVSLASTSRSIDKGKAFGLAFDQRGLPRVVGVASAPGGDGSDIGAFELQSTPSPTPTATPGSLANISTRLQVGTGDNVLFAGFVVSGSASKTVLIKSAGPSLTGFGLPGAMSNPQLELHDAQNTIATNDNWQTTQLGGVITSDQSAAIQNSGAAPSDPAEPAIIATLSAGTYTAIVQGVGGTQGIATVEVYDLSPNNGSRLVNISTRGFIQTGDNVMIGGFIVADQSFSVLIRVTGPSLTAFGINNALANPKLELHDANGTLGGNDDWQTTQLGGIITSDQSAAIQNSGLAPGNPAEPAIIATLAPGSYTVIAQGVNGGTGVGLIEVFALP
jgi:CSLREA domain-containing protein